MKSVKTKKAPVSKSKSFSFLARRPYLTVAVLAALVCALAFTVEIIQEALSLDCLQFPLQQC
jgi:hypothetical protein